MAPDTNLHDLLYGLLLTDQEALRFVCHAILDPNLRPDTPEAGASLLAEHVQRHREQAPQSLFTWLQAARSAPPLHLRALIRVAAFFRDERLVAPLTSLLQQLPLAIVHPAAVRALAQNAGAGAARQLLDLLWSVPPPRWHVREPAILEELGRLGDPDTLPDLLRAFEVPYTNSASAAAHALAAFPADVALEPLLRTLRTAAQPRAAAYAAEALGRLGDPRAISALSRASEGVDPQLAVAAAVALARLNASDAWQRLLRLAASPVIRVRASAIGALGLVPAAAMERHSRDLFNAVTQALLDPQPEVRRAAAYALGLLARAGGAPPVEAALVHEVSPLVRGDMVKALGRIGASSSLPLLTARLATEDLSVRVEILDALACFRDPEVARWIVPYRAAPDKRLVDAANNALRRLLHRPFAWPAPAPAPATPLSIGLYSLEGARERLLPPPPPAPPPGLFGRLFSSSRPAAPPPPPAPMGELRLSEAGLQLILGAGDSSAFIGWDRDFSAHLTREPNVSTAAPGAERDIGVHFTLRQREDDLGTRFQTVAVSLWCAPSEAIGPLPPKSERLPCLDPYHAEPFLAAIQYYTQIYSIPLIPRPL